MVKDLTHQSDEWSEQGLTECSLGTYAYSLKVNRENDSSEESREALLYPPQARMASHPENADLSVHVGSLSFRGEFSICLKRNCCSPAKSRCPQQQGVYCEGIKPYHRYSQELSWPIPETGSQ